MDGPGYQRHTNVQTHTFTSCDCAEIGRAGRLMLLVAWNCVVETATRKYVMDYSGKLAKKTLHYIWINWGNKMELNVICSN